MFSKILKFDFRLPRRLLKIFSYDILDFVIKQPKLTNFTQIKNTDFTRITQIIICVLCV